MNKATRVLAMTGMAVVAGATLGAGSASASPAGPDVAVTKQSATQQKPFGFRDRVVGYYRSPVACHRAGRFGEFRNSWDDYRCVRVRGGWHRNLWALVVSYDGHRWGHGGFPGGWDRHDGWDRRNGHDGWDRRDGRDHRDGPLQRAGRDQDRD